MLLPSYFPAFFTSACCIVGTIVNELRSMPMSDHIAEAALFLLYSGVLIRRGIINPENNNSGDGGLADGVASALAASLILFFFSLPRLNKGPVPVALFASTAAYYAYYAAIIFAGGDGSAAGVSQDPSVGNSSTPSNGS